MAEIRRLEGNHAVPLGLPTRLLDAAILGMGSEAEPGEGKDAVAGLEARDPGSHGLDLARELEA